MKPNRETGGITLEGGRDRRYAKAAARRVGNQAMKDNVIKENNKAWNRLYSHKMLRVSGDEMSNAKMWGWILNYKFTEFKSDAGVIEEVAVDFADDYIGGEPTELGPQFTGDLQAGLSQIATGGIVRALLSFTRRSTASEMLVDITPQIS